MQRWIIKYLEYQTQGAPPIPPPKPHPMQKVWDSYHERREAMLEAYLAGKRQVDIAKEFGVSRGVVSSQIQKAKRRRGYKA